MNDTHRLPRPSIRRRIARDGDLVCVYLCSTLAFDRTPRNNLHEIPLPLVSKPFGQPTCSLALARIEFERLLKAPRCTAWIWCRGREIVYPERRERRRKGGICLERLDVLLVRRFMVFIYKSHL